MLRFSLQLPREMLGSGMAFAVHAGPQAVGFILYGSSACMTAVS